MDDHVYRNIRAALEFLVPMNIAEIRSLSFEERRARAAQDGQIIAEHADKLMYAPRKQPGVLPALARGMAALAYQPGGVQAAGIHACVHPHPGCPVSTKRPSCCICDPHACTVIEGDGECVDDACAWCTNGCPAADRPEQSCCSPPGRWGRICVVE